MMQISKKIKKKAFIRTVYLENFRTSVSDFLQECEFFVAHLIHNDEYITKLLNTKL